MGQSKFLKVTSEEELRFIDYLLNERKFSKMTASSYKEDISLFLGFLARINQDYKTVTTEQIRGYLLDMNNRGLSKATIKRTLAALKHFYSFLFLKDYITYDPFELISSPKMDKKLPDFLTQTETNQLLDANARRKDELADRDQAILELMFASGLRDSEVVNLTLQSVNMRQRIIRVFGKGKKERMVPFSIKAQAAMDNYLKNLRPVLASKCHTPQPVSFFFLNNRGEKLTGRGLEYIMEEIEKKSGCFMKLHPHKLRHSFATHMLSEGADLRTIQELMGHESIGTTQIYTHITYTEMKKTYENAFPRAKMSEEEKADLFKKEETKARD